MRVQSWWTGVGRRIAQTIACFFPGVIFSISAQADELDSQLARGAEIYSESCAICHYDGAGNPVAPDLKGTAYWKDGPQPLIRLILHGQGGVSVVNGQKFNGQMPKMDYLTDEEIAAVTAYSYATFGDKKEAVSPTEVGELRAEKVP